MIDFQANLKNYRRSTLGFTLIELMVSVTIGLILMLFLSSLYFNSKSSSRLNDDNARIQEDGRFALNLIGHNLAQAGYGNMLTGNTTDFPPATSPTLTGLMGCDNGFVTPITATPPTCGGTDSTDSAFAVSYISEPYDATNSPISGAGTDCSGAQATGATSTQGGAITNSFYRDSTTSILYCQGNAGTAQKILSNVDKMKVTYGIDTAANYSPTKQNGSASDAGTADNNDNNKVGWDRVITATVCLEIHSTNNVVSSSAGQTYTNCDGTSVTASDYLLHTTMTQVFTLRNNATPSLVN